MLGDESGKRLAGQQRDVPVRHDDVARQLLEGLEPDAYRVPRTELMLLDGLDRVRSDLVQVGRHLLALVTDDDDEVVWFESGRGSDRVRQHRPAAHLMEELGALRLHARPAARGEDDDGSHTSAGIVGHTRSFALGSRSPGRSRTYVA